jgi:hypothetical protein
MGTPWQRAAYTVRHLRARFWLASVLIISTLSLAEFTLVSPSWIEGVFGAHPDGGSGALEWALAALPFLAVVGLVLARSEWRRARLSYRADRWAAGDGTH